MLIRGCMTSNVSTVINDDPTDVGNVITVSGDWSDGSFGSKLSAGQLGLITAVRFRTNPSITGDNAGIYFYISTNDSTPSAICPRKFAGLNEDLSCALYIFDAPLPFTIDPRPTWSSMAYAETQDTLYVTAITDTSGSGITVYRVELFWEQSIR